MNLLDRFRAGLRKTSACLTEEIQRIVAGKPNLEASALEELEAALIAADLGLDTAIRIVARVKEIGARDVFAIARAEIGRELSTGQTSHLFRAPVPPTIVLIVGVNGTGKTTTTAKLAYGLKQQGNRVMLAACDTFRAAAIEQLRHWADRVDCEFVAGQYGSDPAAVAFDAIAAAVHRGVDYVLVDTAGRLHTKVHLMEEMKKMRRSLQKKLPEAPHEVLLVLDGTTGVNALMQAREFHAALGVTGLVVTKLDGTAKGGIVVTIARELKLPVKLIGLGEQLEDLQPFDPRNFVEALFL